jgi:hypothetical protein
MSQKGALPMATSTGRSPNPALLLAMRMARARAKGRFLAGTPRRLVVGPKPKLHRGQLDIFGGEYGVDEPQG